MAQLSLNPLLHGDEVHAYKILEPIRSYSQKKIYHISSWHINFAFARSCNQFLLVI